MVRLERAMTNIGMAMADGKEILSITHGNHPTKPPCHRPPFPSRANGVFSNVKHVAARPTDVQKRLHTSSNGLRSHQKSTSTTDQTFTALIDAKLKNLRPYTIQTSNSERRKQNQKSGEILPNYKTSTVLSATNYRK